MAGLSDAIENALLDHLLKHVSYTSPTTVYLGLYTANPTDAGGGTEVSGNAYARQAITFGSASGGVSANTAAVTFPAATPSGWGTITGVGIFDASSGGNLLMWSALSPNQVVGANGVLNFPIGQITGTMD